ncbi:abscisic acid 8'-hydroxylase 4-like isoform X2 [Rosa rugosa]|uniref:abscisic acid 8'-hydroxylase 4-like isoform X2 n=1 Tax=Rosa rugosa TaxID=74645 RepID=UPI002B40B589|nr:abscisic acid 8'-hydroxylase 4-like isoform X2 [Rosa rugosa]
MNTVLLYCFVFALLSFILLGKQTRNKPRAKLPPGSMGWPYLGETLQLYSQNPNVFFGTRQQRYGEIFKTHILGSPGVMLCSPEAIRFVLVTQAHLFKPTYPKSKEKLIGPSALFFHQDDYHTQMRRLVQESLSLDAIKNLVPDIEAIAISTLDSWSGGQIVNTFYELKKARRRLSLILGEIIKERKENKLVEKDLLGSLLKFKDEQGQTLTHNQILDNIIGVLFAAQDTTATLLTWILKYMHDYSELLEAIQVEQKAIFAANEGGNQSLSWAQTRNMPLTSRAIKESLRMASIISFTFREAVEDVEYKGYLIRKGWKVLPLFRNIHHNPDFFNEPHNFNPSRFELGIRPNTFVPFGNGVHTCPGNEVAKTEILIFIYHLVNKFRWEAAASDGGIHYDPFPVPQQGLPAKFWKEYSGSQGALYDKRAN